MPFSLRQLTNFFRGTVLTGLADTIPDGAFRLTKNIRVDRTRGAITNRPGWTAKTSSAIVASTAVTWVGKLFSSTDYSYARVSTAVYRLTDAWASAALITTTGSTNLSDANTVDGLGNIWKFVVDGTIAKKDDGTSIWEIGIPPPTAVPSAVALAADLTTTINAMDDHTEWAASAGATGKANETNIKVEGTGSVTFNVAASTLGDISDFFATKDLDTLSGGDDVVKNDDYIHLMIRVDRPERVDYIQLDFDVDPDTTGTADAFRDNFYSVRLPALTRLNRGRDQWTKLQVRKSEFSRSGNHANDWANVVAARISILTNSIGAVTVYVDDFKLRGGVDMEGDMEYTVTYRFSTTGCRGNPYKDANGVVQYTTALTTDRQRITLTTTNVAEGGAGHPADAQISNMTIWRKSASFAQAQFIAHQADTATSYTDSTGDYQLVLNAIALETDNDVPPTGTTRVLFGPSGTGHMFMIVDGHRLYISKQFEDNESRHENWPEKQFALIGDGSHAALAGIATETDIFVWNENQTFQVVGSSGLFIVVPIPDSHEIVGQYAVAAGAGSVFFVANDGIYEQRGGVQQKLTTSIDKFFNGVTVDGHIAMATASTSRADIRLAYAAKAEGDFLVMLYPEGSATTCDKSLVLKRNPETGRFTEVFFDSSDLTNLRSLYVDTEENEIIAGGENGNVYLIDDETKEDDAGTDMPIQFRTKSDDYGAPLNKKKVGQVFLEGNTNSESLTVTAYYGRNATTEALGTMSTSTINTISYHTPADSETRRDDLAIDVTGTTDSRVTITRIASDILIMPEARRFFDTGLMTFGQVRQIKLLELDLYNPDAVITVRVYIGGTLKSTTVIQSDAEQRVIRHFLQSGLKGKDLRVTLTSTGDFELHGGLVMNKPLGTAQGWEALSLREVA